MLNPGGSSLPDLLIHGKPGFYVICEVVLIGKDDAECGGIFNRLTGPLGLKRLFVSQSLRAPLGERMGGSDSPSLGVRHHP